MRIYKDRPPPMSAGTRNSTRGLARRAVTARAAAGIRRTYTRAPAGILFRSAYRTAAKRSVVTAWVLVDEKINPVGQLPEQPHGRDRGAEQPETGAARRFTRVTDDRIQPLDLSPHAIECLRRPRPRGSDGRRPIRQRDYR